MHSGRRVYLRNGVGHHQLGVPFRAMKVLGNQQIESTAFWLRENASEFGHLADRFRSAFGVDARLGSVPDLEIGLDTGRSISRAGQTCPVGILSKKHPKHRIRKESMSRNARMFWWQRLQVLKVRPIPA